ncbi:MAG: hypothetical protein KA435_01620 [Azonexus sp.]|nr:hypothetical protein [Azonexus sp.]MBP6201731.1 hypothetical protein [Azonexus sp.]
MVAHVEQRAVERTQLMAGMVVNNPRLDRQAFAFVPKKVPVLVIEIVSQKTGEEGQRNSERRPCSEEGRGEKNTGLGGWFQFHGK